MIVKNRLKMPLVFKDYLLVYSDYQKTNYNEKEVETLIDSFIKVGPALGVKFSEPKCLACESNIESWKFNIQKYIYLNGKIQIIILFLQH